MYEDKIWRLEAFNLLSEHNSLIFKIDDSKLWNIALALNVSYLDVKCMFNKLRQWRYFIKVKDDIYRIGLKYLEEENKIKLTKHLRDIKKYGEVYGQKI